MRASWSSNARTCVCIYMRTHIHIRTKEHTRIHACTSQIHARQLLSLAPTHAHTCMYITNTLTPTFTTVVKYADQHTISYHMHITRVYTLAHRSTARLRAKQQANIPGHRASNHG